MRRLAWTAGAVVAGAVAGATLMLALPMQGMPAEPEGASPEPAPGAGLPRTLGEAPVHVVLAWTPGGLPSGYAGRVRRSPIVRRATAVRSGVAWLESWSDRGSPIGHPPEGFAVPVEIAAVSPRAYRAFVPPPDRPAVGALARGGVLLSRTAAELRGVGAGGTLEVGGMRLRVLGTIDDELVGAHELVVSVATGTKLGVVRPRYLLVAPREAAPRRRVHRALRRPLPPGTRLRVREPGETPVFRHGDAVLPPLELKRLFGEFSAAPLPGGYIRTHPAWEGEHIRTARVPILGSVRCHRLVIPLLRGALEELARRRLGGLVDPGDYGGCYSPRFANRDPSAGLSHHAWGVAVDLNVSENPLGSEPRIDRRVVEVFERWGFTWGGRWLVPDPMHFEFLRFPARI